MPGRRHYFTRSSRDEIGQHAHSLMRACRELTIGPTTVHLTDVLALGGNGITYLGWASTGRRVVAKVPVAFVAQEAAVISGGEVERFERIVARLREEARWLDAFRDLELFPRKFFPSRAEVPIVTVAHRKILLPVLILEYLPEPSIREVLTSIHGSSQVLRVTSGTGTQRAAEIVAGIAVGLLRGLDVMLKRGGVYTDLAPDNVLTGSYGRPVVFLDAGAIVSLGTGVTVPVRTAIVPTAFEKAAAQLPSLPHPELQAVLVGTVAKLVASLLTGARHDDADDPSSAQAAAYLPRAQWLEEFLARGMRHAGRLFNGLDDAVAFIESRTHTWIGGPMMLRKQFAAP